MSLHKDLSGHVFIVTGANSGIGFETSRELALNGATVILACRQPESGKEAQNQITKQVQEGARFGQGRALYEPLDLTVKDSIESFVNNFINMEIPLYGIVLNAGTGFLPKRVVLQGSPNLEICFATNVLGHYHLVTLLWSKIIKDNTRIITVSSSLHKYVHLEPYDDTTEKKRLSDLQSTQSYDPTTAYAKSKLAGLLLAYMWARRLESTKGTNAISIALHPGIVNTRLSRHQHIIKQYLFKCALYFFGKSALQGCQTTLYSCSQPVSNGCYYGDCKEEKSSPESYDEYAAFCLENECIDLINNHM